MTAQQRSLIEHALTTIDDKDGEARYTKWLEWLRKGEFGFAAVDLSFDKVGENSWKQQTRGQGFTQDGNFFIATRHPF